MFLSKRLQSASKQGVSLDPVDVTWIERLGDSGNKNTYSYSGISFGAEDPNRQMAFLFYDGGRNISSCSINGTSCSFIDFEPTLDIRMGIAFANVPTGTTGSFSYTVSGSSANRSLVHVYRVISTQTSYDSYFFDDGSSPFSATVSVEAGDGIIGGAWASNTNVNFTWTGLVEDDDYSLEGGSLSGASLNVASTDASFNIGCTFSSSVSMAGVVWKP